MDSLRGFLSLRLLPLLVSWDSTFTVNKHYFSQTFSIESFVTYRWKDWRLRWPMEQHELEPCWNPPPENLTKPLQFSQVRTFLIMLSRSLGIGSFIAFFLPRQNYMIHVYRHMCDVYRHMCHRDAAGVSLQVCTGNYTATIPRCVMTKPPPSKRIILPLQVGLYSHINSI